MIFRLRPLPAGLRPTSFFYIIATWFHSGRIRPASGSWGSLAALPICWAIKAYGGIAGVALFAVVVAIIGTRCVAIYLQHSTTQDPSEVVIDEVLGMALLFLTIPAENVSLVLFGFIMFRILDSLKPWPINWCDKNIKGAWGVMCDDLVGGLIAAALVAGLQILT